MSRVPQRSDLAKKLGEIHPDLGAWALDLQDQGVFDVDIRTRLMAVMGEVSSEPTRAEQQVIESLTLTAEGMNRCIRQLNDAGFTVDVTQYSRVTLESENSFERIVVAVSRNKGRPFKVELPA